MCHHGGVNAGLERCQIWTGAIAQSGSGFSSPAATAHGEALGVGSPQEQAGHEASQTAHGRPVGDGHCGSSELQHEGKTGRRRCGGGQEDHGAHAQDVVKQLVMEQHMSTRGRTNEQPSNHGDTTGYKKKQSEHRTGEQANRRTGEQANNPLTRRGAREGMDGWMDG